MPLSNLSFAATQNYGDIKTLSLEDTASGSDGTVTGKRIYLQLLDGTYLKPTGVTTDYITWTGTTKDISNVLDKDYCILIKVDWMAGSSVAYTATELYLFKAYTELFLYNLTQYQSSNPNLVNGKNFIEQKMKLREYLDSAIQAVSLADDQASASLMLGLAKELTDNQVYFF